MLCLILKVLATQRTGEQQNDRQTFPQISCQHVSTRQSSVSYLDTIKLHLSRSCERAEFIFQYRQRTDSVAAQDNLVKLTLATDAPNDMVYDIDPT